MTPPSSSSPYSKWSPPLKPRLPLKPLSAYSRIEYERICEHGVSVSLCLVCFVAALKNPEFEGKDHL